MENKIKELSKKFKILSNENRLCIVTNLYLQEEKKVSDLQNCTGVSQSFVSQQLSKLKAMKIVESRKEGKEVYYRLIDKDIKKMIANILDED